MYGRTSCLLWLLFFRFVSQISFLSLSEMNKLCSRDANWITATIILLLSTYNFMYKIRNISVSHHVLFLSSSSDMRTFHKPRRGLSLSLLCATCASFFPNFWSLLCANKQKKNLSSSSDWFWFVGLVGVEGKSDFEAAQLAGLAAQDALDPVVPVGEPVGQIHVGQVEVWLGQRVRARFEGAVAGQAVAVQRLRTVLTRWDQLV